MPARAMIGVAVAIGLNANTARLDRALAVGFAGTLPAGGVHEEPQVVSLFDTGRISCASRTCSSGARSIVGVTGREGVSHKKPMPKNTVVVTAATAPTVTR